MERAHRRRAVTLGLVLAGVLLASSPGALALDPALDVSQYAHTAWEIRDGFTKGAIYAIAQTPDGYLWLGTDFGLFRFDGVRAVPWQPPAGEQLPSSEVRRLLATRDGTLWIGTLKGLARWKDGKLTQYLELAGEIIATLLEDREGTVWAGEWSFPPPGRLCAIQRGSVQCYGEDSSLGNGVLGLYEDSKGNLWAGVKDGLWRWKPGPPKFYSLPGEPNGIQGLAEDADGALLISLRGGVRRFVDGKTVMAHVYPGPDRQLQALKLLRGSRGALWIGTEGKGLVHVHRGRTDVVAESDGLSGDHIHVLFEDREGNIWVATNRGLDRFRDYAVATFSVKQGLSDAYVGSVLVARDGSVWLTTNGSLERWKDGQVTDYGKRNSELKGANSLFQDDRGRIWVCTRDGVGYMRNDRFVSVTGIPGGNVHGFAEDTAVNLWIANQDHGLFRLVGDKVVERIPWTSLGHKEGGTALAADPLQGGVWLGFYQGGVVDFRDGQVRASYSSVDGLGEGRVNRFRFDPDGTVWAATEGGLSRLKNGRIATLTGKNGLPCDAANWVIQDNDHAFWLNMPCGLVRIVRSEIDTWAAAVDKGKDAKRTIQATVFDSSDGVTSQGDPGGYVPAVTRSSDGKLWFAPYDGFSVIDPGHLPFNKVPPPVQVEQVTADRKTYDPASYGSGRVPLPARIRDLEINYTALSLVAPEKVRFRYKLEGRDRDWQDAGNRRQAFYSDLPPRNYRFRVMACNNSGVWNEAGAFLDFSVAPAYFQTTWFLALCVAAFLALLWATYQQRLRQVAREFNARLEERTRIARELHDSLLQSVQGLMFRLQAVRDMVPGPPEAIEAFDIALDRGDKAIAEARDTVTDLRSTVGTNDMAEALTALTEELAHQKSNGTGPCVRVLVEGKPRDLNPLLRDEVYRIAREALRNAFLHAQAHKIEAEITYADSQLLLHVRDDGNGIAPEVLDKGRSGHWGIPGMRERAKSFGGKLEVWSEHGAGTEVALIIPASIAYGKSSTRQGFRFLRKKK